MSRVTEMAGMEYGAEAPLHPGRGEHSVSGGKEGECQGTEETGV